VTANNIHLYSAYYGRKEQKTTEKKISNRREMQEDTYVDYQIKCTSSIGNKVKQRFSWGKNKNSRRKTAAVS